MESRGLGFFCKPKIKIKNLEESREIIYSKKFKDIMIYIRADSLITIELFSEINSIKDETGNMLLDKLKFSRIYTQYANVIYLLFKNSYDKIIRNKRLSLPLLELYEIVGDESISVYKNNKVWEISGMQGDSYGKISYNMAAGFSSSESIFQYEIIDKIVLDEIINDFDNNIKKFTDDKNTWQIFLLLQKSCMAATNGNDDISIILSWTVIERIINKFWSDLLEEKVSSTRKNSILSIKEYTASVKTNELLLNGIITEATAKEIDRIRKYRNKIMHGDYSMFEEEGKINRKYDELMPIVLKSLKVACNCIELYYKMETNIENRINIQLY